MPVIVLCEGENCPHCKKIAAALSKEGELLCKPFLCRLGLHRDIFVSVVSVILPKAGRFDPRTSEQRTVTRDLMTCARCGRRKIENYSW